MPAAHDRSRPHVRRTPVRTSDCITALTGAQLHFKCGIIREPGAFKVRGAVDPNGFLIPLKEPIQHLVANRVSAILPASGQRRPPTQ